ncbi:blastula protease 10-like [Daphnia pulex]|uniref:blastula protease 10-like n=1 Tax=Daphnia pulex TaxID=6669 RepID=UPI001EDD8928|nr:blastula protease 10-like [Daphnia pulex]
MKSFPIFFLLAVAATGEALGEICNSRKTPTKMIARRTWPSQIATTTAKSTTVNPSTTTAPTTTTTTATTTTTMATTTTPLPILFNCSVSDPAACGTMCTNLTSGGGVVQSPDFPGDYGNDSRVCKIVITAPAGWMIQLNFTTFNLETDVGYVGITGDLTYLFFGATGNTIPAVPSTTTNMMSIGFQCSASSKPSNAVYNWQATFSVTSEGNSCSATDSACGNMCTNVTSAGTGVVQSPDFPGDYGSKSKICKVIIIVPAGKRIQLTFTTFNLETGKGSIKGNDRITTYLDSVTGSTIPDVVTTTSNVMLLQFISSRSTKPNTAIYNWQATYTAV